MDGGENRPSNGAAVTLTPGRCASAQFAETPCLDDGPEVREMTFGFLPLTDCAPLIVAHERGFLGDQGITSSLHKSASWTSSRDRLVQGEAHATHMLFGMPVAAAVGRLGSSQQPLIIPWILSRSGQAITLASRHREVFRSHPRDLRPLALESRDRGRPLVFGMTLAPGTHAMWLRYWLAAGGIDPDRDVALVTIPPPQMNDNLRMGQMDGFCVGEPWNALAEESGIGFTAALTESIWPNHPEKVLAFTEGFAEAHPGSVVATLRAVRDAAAWCDDASNLDELAALLAEDRFIGRPARSIRSRLGDARFSTGNFPQPKYAVWWLSQFRRWGMLTEAPDYAGVAARVMRLDFYQAAMAQHEHPDASPEELFDGVTFDPSAPEAYAAGFPITSLAPANTPEA